ncbi:RepB family plasmid replication initiator protein [Planococcus versutus]|uniref:Initiator Rep protein WH1 domain-containing protein n=1 Tax=Planococcus versutus TaxID=1302659 RepID=A0A1B1S4Y7_9BACL|nr:RepB family plasmid replication initiator protein [Planococcus versutus]ANU28267.1 hypothetical protein I858_014845 [Planococcus versutus]
MLGLEGLDSNVIFKGVVEELLSKVVEIPREHGDWMMTHWIESVKYVEGSNVIRFGLSPDIKPYFMRLKRYLFP